METKTKNTQAEVQHKIATANAAGFITQFRGDTGATKEAATAAYKRACDISTAVHTKRASIRQTVLTHLKGTGAAVAA